MYRDTYHMEIGFFIFLTDPGKKRKNICIIPTSDYTGLYQLYAKKTYF